MIHIASLIAAALLFVLSSAGHAASTLIIQGVEGELAENIRLLVSQPPEKENDRQFRRYVEALPEQVVTAMSAYGYYAAEVDISVDEVAPPTPKKGAGKAVERVEKTVDKVIGSKPGTKKKPATKSQDAAQASASITQVTINVTPNAPVKVKSLDVQITGLAKDNTDFNAVLKQVRTQLAKGRVFVSSEYESAKSSLQTTALELGYFDFEFTSTQVKVSRRALSANIVIEANAGARFSFGELQFKQRTFSESFLDRWVPFSTGDPYQASLIGELTQDLQNSGYFSSVRVRPLIDPRYENTVPVVVDLTVRDDNQVAVGIGYSTDTKVRTKLTWGKPLINSRGHSAEWGVSLARDIQSASFAYRIPRSKDPLFNYWGIEYGLKNDLTGDLDSFLSTLNLQRVKRTPKDWTESFFVRWERERFDREDGADDIGPTTQTTDLVMPGFSYSRSRSKGDPFATWGQSLSFQLMGGSKSVLSTIDFLKTVGRFSYLRAVSDKNTFIGNVQYGAIHSNDYDRVPVTQRFFAGGDRTVRGFGYKEISPRNILGTAIGGRFLEVLSLEYNYRFRDQWSAALFTDAGRAFNRFSTGYSVGAGFGVRWQSPVGPFRIDIARPVSDGDGDDIRVHLSLGSDF